MSVTAIPQSPSFLDPAFSSTADVVKTGKQWANEGGVKWVGAHTIIPAVTIASAALDTLVQAFSAVIKTAIFIPGTVVYIASFGKIDFAPTANLSSILQHTARTGGDLTMVAVMPLTSFFSCDSALAILDGLKLAPGASGEPAPKGVWANIQAQQCLKNKAIYILNHKQDVTSAAGSAISTGVVTGASVAKQYHLHIPAIVILALGALHGGQKVLGYQDTLVTTAWGNIESNVSRGYDYFKSFFVNTGEPVVDDTGEPVDNTGEPVDNTGEPVVDDTGEPVEESRASKLWDMFKAQSAAGQAMIGCGAVAGLSGAASLTPYGGRRSTITAVVLSAIAGLAAYLNYDASAAA